MIDIYRYSKRGGEGAIQRESELWCTCFITKTEVLFFLSLCSTSITHLHLLKKN